MLPTPLPANLLTFPFCCLTPPFLPAPPPQAVSSTLTFLRSGEGGKHLGAATLLGSRLCLSSSFQDRPSEAPAA